MIAILYLLALSAVAQTPASSLFTVLPKSDGSATGCLNFRELAANGLNYGCLKAPSDIYANRTVTLPEYTTTLVGTVNPAYGQTFTLAATRYNGTEASPANVTNGDIMFQFLGNARRGGSVGNAAWLNFSVDDATSGTFSTSAQLGLSVNGAIGTQFNFSGSNFYGSNGQDVGLSFARFGNFYGKTADFSIPGTADTSWVTTQNFQILDNNGGTAFWRWKGYANAINKYVWLEDDAGAQYAVFHTQLSGNPFRFGFLKANWDPMTDNTYALGSSGRRWSDVRTNFVTATGIVQAPIFDLTTGSPSNGYRVNGTTVIDTSRNANVVNLTVTGTCTGCSGVSSAPLGEVKITDYGATSNCTTPTTVRAALASALAALPTDASGKKSGIVTFPAGCYGWDIANGSLLLDRAGATPIGDIWLIGAGAGSEFAAVGAGTEIRAIGSAPASATAMVEFRKILGGGMRNIQINAAGISNTRILKIRESRFGRFENLQGRRWTSGPGLEFASESGATSGSCHNNFIGLNLGDVKDTDQASGILFDGQVAGYSACSNKFTHGIVIYSKSGSATYGIKQRYADNNTLDRFNVWASDCTAFPCESNAGTGRTNGTMPAFTMEQYSGDKTFPKENFFDGTLTAANGYLITGVSGTSGNRINHTLDDCGGLLVGCFPVNIRNVRGSTSFGAYMSRAAFPHNDATQATYTLDQTNGNFTSGGRLNFARQDRTWAAIYADSAAGGGLNLAVNNSATCTLFASVGSRSVHAASTLSSIGVSFGTATANIPAGHGCAAGDRIRVSEGQVSGLNGDFTVTNAPSSTQLQWSTSAANGTYSNDGLTVEVAPIPYWQIVQGGTLRPVSNGLASIGTQLFQPSTVWGQSFQSYLSSAATHRLVSDAALNLYLDSYGGSGADPRPAINLERSRGTQGVPLAIAANDRLGAFAFWGNTGNFTSTFAVGAVIESYATAVSGATISGDLRFRTINFGSSNTALQLLPSGAASFLSTVDATTYNATGSPAYRVNGTTVINASRDGNFVNMTISGTCTGCGSTPANMMTTDTSQFVSGLKTFSISPEITDANGIKTIVSGVLRSNLGSTLNMYNSFGSLVFQVSATGNVIAGGTVSASTNFIAAGNSGMTSSFTCGSGLAVKSMNIVGGIVVSVTCGAP